MTIKSLKEKLSSPYFWCFSTYFAEGFPFTLIRTLSSFFFRDMKVSLESIGLTSLFGLPWVLKFLWSPLVDTFGTKRKWIISLEIILVAIIFLVALLSPVKDGVSIIALLFFLSSFVAATHDVVIDGFYMDVLSKEEQSTYVGYRIMAYRIAMITGTAGIATIGSKWGWEVAFSVAGFIFLLPLLFHFFFLPKSEVEKYSMNDFLKWFLKMKIIVISILMAFTIFGLRTFLSSITFIEYKKSYPLLKEFTFANSIALTLFVLIFILIIARKKIKERFLSREENSLYLNGFIIFIDREGVGVMIFLIIFLRTGEAMLSSMVSPFIVDLGIKIHYGWISGGVGLVASIVGAIIGGYLIGKFSLRKTLWPIILLQNLTNLVYMVLAANLETFIASNTGASLTSIIPLSAIQLGEVAFVHGFDQFAGGLGTAVLTTFLMRLCLPNYKAVHFAIGSGLMNISGLIVGAISGFIVAKFGYSHFFGISFLFSLPGMILIFFLPKEIIQDK